MARIEQTVPERSVDLKGEWLTERTKLEDLLNREIYPLLRALRRAVNGPFRVTEIQTEDYQVLLSDDLVRVDTTGGAFLATLPAGAAIGSLFHFADAGGDCGSTVLTVTVQTGETIAGGLTTNLATDYGTLSLLKLTDELWVVFE
jgi:hypothetical protein